MQPERKWNTKLLGFALGDKHRTGDGALFSLLPVGLLQTYQSVSVGYWSARSPEFMQSSLMQTLRWSRIAGDTIFAIGALAFVWFALDLMLTKGRRHQAPIIDPQPESAALS
jgi:nitric oxide reductase subunit B